MSRSAPGLILHATTVAHAGRGLLILGPSGAGKSALAIRMIALGARLVSDDRSRIGAEATGLVARCPSDAIRGRIEARGIGLLRLAPLERVLLSLAVDLGQAETERLPPPRRMELLGHQLPLVLRPQNNHLAEALMLCLAGAWPERG
ncbi:HPr kinase/phosphorylase [Pseudogemmobacter sonorensis]|uniref:HPr kinase/phosphorylase n=1 Tax=Pseudogemmobacter sonorensis TaxID=2989681 RepID=UPI0036BC6A71